MVELNNLTSIQEAKDALYNGKKLTKDFEKDIFNSTLLSPNNALDTNLLRETALLLEKVKKAEEMTKGDAEAQSLLDSLRTESDGQTVPYQVVNSGNSQLDREVIHLTTLLGKSPDRHDGKTKTE